jgi:hypothetical protein
MAEIYSLKNVNNAERAVSAYEEKLFGNLMKKQSVENLQRNAANNVMQGSLRYIFTIFQ